MVASSSKLSNSWFIFLLKFLRSDGEKIHPCAGFRYVKVMCASLVGVIISAPWRSVCFTNSANFGVVPASNFTFVHVAAGLQLLKKYNISNHLSCLLVISANEFPGISQYTDHWGKGKQDESNVNRLGVST